MDSAPRRNLRLDSKQKASVFYHDKFDYPLKKDELDKWLFGRSTGSQIEVDFKKGFYFLNGRQNIIVERLERQKYSKRKLYLAKKAARVLKLVPTIRMVAVTGSLAMENAKQSSDIDLMIITHPNSLWITRGITLVFLKLLRFKLRRAGDKDEKDKLCLNLWLTNNDLAWKEKNEFVAHEIAQIMPLVNKSKTYEKFIFANKWLLRFWPNSVKVKNMPREETLWRLVNILLPLEKLAYFIQYQYMKPKITKEVVSQTRAMFHPRKLY